MKSRNIVKKIGSKFAIGGGAFAASSSAFAADYTALITQAQTDATGNQSLVIIAVISVAVLSFGAGALLMWLRK